MYKLYYSPSACSLAIHALLNELNVNFIAENANISDRTRSAEFLKINPRGAVPVLKIDDFILREGVAIMLYLLENHENDLLPKSALKKAEVLEWLCFANSTLHPAYSRCFFAHRILGENAAQNELYEPSIKAIQKYWDEIEERLLSREYICGDKCSIADILITVIANWSPVMKSPINFGVKTKEFFKRVISRPSYQKAMEKEGVSYKVAS